MNQKKLITILATITIIAILSVSLFTQFSAATATTYNTDNITVNGVLASDSYVLYPFRKENLIFGISKYGELINGVGKVGLEYDGLDVFANPNVLEKDWSQGWFIDIHYADLENNYKRAWAFALYSDLSGSTGIGGDWKEGCTAGPLGTPYGGRKTNVWATTDSIKVLYDGPRRFVALTKTTLYDASTKTADDVLVSITITFVFDKDKKVVTLFKDIKRLATGKFGRTFQIEFSNRGEWDIGTTSAPKSYAHFYDNQPTVYDYEYHDFYGVAYPLTGYDVCQMIDEDGTYVGFAAFWPQLYGKLVDGTTHITRSTILSSLCTVTKNETWSSLGSPQNKIINITALGWPSSDPFPIGLGATSDEPMVFKNKILLAGGGVDYTWTGGATDTITFVVEPLDTDYITIVYKHEVNPEADDMISHAAIEPDTPYVIGEWCFDLRNEDYKRQFRAVTVYGLTDRHDADDNDAAAETWSAGANVIDAEVQYYLKETFNPYDLYSAVEKLTKRDVEFFKGDGITTDFELEYIPIGLVDWDAYCTFAERVLVGGVLAYPDRADATFGFYNYTLCDWPDPAGWGINFTKAPAKGTVIKVLYSTMDRLEMGRYEWMVVGKDAATIDSIGAAYMTEAFDSIKHIDVQVTGLDINDTANGPYAPFVMGGATTGTRTDYRDTLGRTFLRDDWCTTYPVSSSNMLFSGGPEVNLGAEYFNEFTNAFWARTEYVVNDTGQAYKIFALSCWNRNSYGSGYAVISVYKDLNGTIGFLIWGTTGQDTYYTAKWFWDYPAGITAPDGTKVFSGIEYLQLENRGVTDIVLKIKYPTLDPTHPTVSIKERLGTISEKTPHDP